MPLPPSLEVLAQYAEPKGLWPHVNLGFDPGHTTGVALIHEYKLVWARQLKTDNIANTWVSVYGIFEEVLATYNAPSISVACEDYKVYDWKAESHSWSKVHTIKVVGLVQFLCHHHSLDLRMRMASNAKAFMDDDKLKAWGLWQDGQRHARDAIRHAAYNSVFRDASISE